MSWTLLALVALGFIVIVILAVTVVAVLFVRGATASVDLQEMDWSPNEGSVPVKPLRRGDVWL